MDNITLDLNNLTEAERETLMALVKKGNEPESKIWKPKYHDTYWIIDSLGKINRFTWCDDNYDKLVYEIGNVFPSEEIATEERKRQEIMTKWRRLSIEAGELENPWDGHHDHWYLHYDCVERRFGYTKANGRWNTGNICFPTKEALKAAIEKIGRPYLVRYVLGIGLTDPYSYQGAREAQEAAE